MGFYSNKTPEEKRVNELTGDIHLCEEFKNELEARKIPLYKGYNIQKRLRLEVEQEKLCSMCRSGIILCPPVFFIPQVLITVYYKNSTTPCTPTLHPVKVPENITIYQMRI